MPSPVPDLSSPGMSWQERFSAEGYLYGTAPDDFLSESVDQLPQGRALCLAEGAGRNAVYLASKGYDVSSIDLTKAGVAKTPRLAADRHATVIAIVGDLAIADVGA